MNEEITLDFTFEQLAPAVLGPFRFEGIQSSIDNENTYTLEIEVLEPPRPEPVPPVVTEPIIVSGKYEEVLNLTRILTTLSLIRCTSITHGT